VSTKVGIDDYVSQSEDVIAKTVVWGLKRIFQQQKTSKYL
jgi:hypothetical protein